MGLVIKKQKAIALTLVSGMLFACLTACAPADTGNNGKRTKKYKEDECEHFSMLVNLGFMGELPPELEEDNEIQKLIAEKTGVYIDETFAGHSTQSAIESLIYADSYPDILWSNFDLDMLYDENVLVAWDEYIEKYPNLKAYYTDEEWDLFRQDDGHIYWADLFDNTYGEDKETNYTGPAFWIQVRVLEWAGYPEIKTLDQYFDLLEAYYKEHPDFVDPQGNTVKIIPYSGIGLSAYDDTIKLPPELLDGNPYQYAVNINTSGSDKPAVDQFDTSRTAQRYYHKLNEEYVKGIVDGDIYSQDATEYNDKICNGSVLGMFDFGSSFQAYDSLYLKDNGYSGLGCDYVPLGLTIDEGMTNRYLQYGSNISTGTGCCIVGKNLDPKQIDKIFRFFDDLLGSQELHDLRFWGIEGVDYRKDNDGLFYRTPEMRENCASRKYKASHLCPYNYLPYWHGTSRDGKNSMLPEDQTTEFYDSCSAPLSKCLQAYKAGSLKDMLGSDTSYEREFWRDRYSTNIQSITIIFDDYDSPGYKAWSAILDVQREWLPDVITTGDFDTAWSQYMNAYSACDPDAFLEEAQSKLDKTIELYGG